MKRFCLRICLILLPILLSLSSCGNQKTLPASGGTPVPDPPALEALGAAVEGSTGTVYAVKRSLPLSDSETPTVYRFEDQRFDPSRPTIEKDGVSFALHIVNNGSGYSICDAVKINEKGDYDYLASLLAALSFTGRAPAPETAEILCEAEVFENGESVRKVSFGYDGTAIGTEGNKKIYAAVDEPTLLRLAVMSRKYGASPLVFSVDEEFIGTVTVTSEGKSATLSGEDASSLIARIFPDRAYTGSLLLNPAEGGAPASGYTELVVTSSSGTPVSYRIDGEGRLWLTKTAEGFVSPSSLIAVYGNFVYRTTVTFDLAGLTSVLNEA